MQASNSAVLVLHMWPMWPVDFVANVASGFSHMVNVAIAIAIFLSVDFITDYTMDMPWLKTSNNMNIIILDCNVIISSIQIHEYMSFISCVAEHVIKECFNELMNSPKFNPLHGCNSMFMQNACLDHELVQA